MAQVGEHAAFAVIIAMVVGAGDQVNAQPVQFSKVLGVRACEGATS